MLLMYGHNFIISYITSFDIDVQVNIFGNGCSKAELAFLAGQVWAVGISRFSLANFAQFTL